MKNLTLTVFLAVLVSTAMHALWNFAARRVKGEPTIGDDRDRIARLGLIAREHFRVFWDNAYAVHVLYDDAPPLASIRERCLATMDAGASDADRDETLRQLVGDRLRDVLNPRLNR